MSRTAEGVDIDGKNAPSCNAGRRGPYRAVVMNNREGPGRRGRPSWAAARAGRTSSAERAVRAVAAHDQGGPERDPHVARDVGGHAVRDAALRVQEDAACAELTLAVDLDAVDDATGAVGEVHHSLPSGRTPGRSGSSVL